VPRRPLVAQFLDHRVDVCVVDRDGRHVECQLLERSQRDFGIDLERRAVDEMLVAAGIGAAQRLDARAARRVQFLLGNRARVGRADDVRHDFVAHLAAVVLPDHFLRHFTRPEPLELGRLADLREPGRDGPLDFRRRHAHRHPSFQPRRGLERDLIAL
jgi:hypothetical protein